MLTHWSSKPKSNTPTISVEKNQCQSILFYFVRFMNTQRKVEAFVPNLQSKYFVQLQQRLAKKQNKTKPSSESSGLWARFLISPVLLLKTPARGESPQPVVTLAILKLATSYYFIFVTSSAGLRLD